MLLRIGQAEYQLTPAGNEAWALHRAGRLDHYIVDDSGDRTVCDCPDWRYRHADLDGSVGCKHIRALRELGLVRGLAAPQGGAAQAPSPSPAPVSRD